jgi:hypothetical protein
MCEEQGARMDLKLIGGGMIAVVWARPPSMLQIGLSISCEVIPREHTNKIPSILEYALSGLLVH